MILSAIKKASVSLILLATTFSNGSPLKSDETVVFFPTSASLNENSKWEVPIHHWIFEKQENGISQKLAQKLLAEIAETLDIPEEKVDTPVFQQRLMWFLVDNERNKNIEIVFDKSIKGGSAKSLNLSSANGHADTIVKLPDSFKPGDWLNYQVPPSKENNNIYSGQTQLIPITGLSIISDIDDTVKVSEVLDKKALIKNTFTEDYKATEGMPAYYQKLKKQEAYFHYVSASPWQLYPSIKPFMDKHYPQGTFSLRNFRLKDSSLFKFLQSSEEYKIEQIKNIIGRYPKHQFVLIGDSGEHDPEVYAKIYTQFPDNIKSVLIRAVPDSDLSSERFTKTFAALPQATWKVFSNPAEMQ